MRSRWLAAILPALLLAVFALRGVGAMRADGTTVDEPWHLGYGERGLAHGTFLRTRELNSKMPVSVLNALPVALAGQRTAAAAQAGQIGPEQKLTWRRTLFLARLPSLALGVLLGWLVWLWARALFGYWGGALALFLYTFCPNILAHSHLVTTDISTSLAMFAAVFLLWRHLQRPGRGRLLAAATAFGLAQLTKATAMLLVPIFGALLLADAWLAARQQQAAAGDAEPAEVQGKDRMRHAARRVGARLWHGAAPLALACGIATLAALNLGFAGEGTFTPLRRYDFISDRFQALARVPVLRDVPLPLPYAYVQGLDMVAYDSRAPVWSYLHGQYSLHGFKSYFLLALLVKVPLGTQLMAALALGLWLWRRPWQGSPAASAAGHAGEVASGGATAAGEVFLLLPAVLMLAYFSLAFQLDIGVRYVLPALPFLFVLAARLAAPGAARRPWPALLAGALAAWVAVASWSIHPDYLTYFNELAGGPAGGWRWLIDSNLDWDQQGDFMRQTYVPSSPSHVFVEPSGPLAGRIATGVTGLVGRDPESAARMAWLRDNFKPAAVFGRSWMVFDVSEADLARCCAGIPRAAIVEDVPSDLALSGQAVAGADAGLNVRYLERLHDGMLGAGAPADAVRTAPAQPRPVHAWFGITWPGDRFVGRVVAFPSFSIRPGAARRFLALDYVFQSWDGTAWRDLPGTRGQANQKLRLEYRFPPAAMRGIRLVVERERNDQGAVGPGGGYRAACLELAAYPQ